VRCAVRVTFHGNGWNGDDRTFGEPLFQIIIFRFALSESKPPTVIVNRNVDVVRIIKGCALRSKVASSKFHFGEACFQMSFAKSCRFLS
jgi:hypothetical protein